MSSSNFRDSGYAERVQPPVLDQHQRPLRTLRLSVTDRCNLRCTYCMPEENYRWLPRHELLDFDELSRAARLAVQLGVNKIRITGGEPLLRRDLEQLLLKLKRIDGLKTLALTTNGTCLADKAQLLRDAGLDQLTVSLDSVDARRFEELSQRPLLAETLQGIAKAREVGFETIKLDTVATLAQSDEDLLMLLDFAWKNRIQPRLIEYMDVGGATAWRPELVRSRQQLLAAIEARHGVAVPLPGRGAAPAEMFRLPGGQLFGIIASVSQPFCGDCDRARLTANGLWLNCLYAEQGHDLKQLLRSGASDGRVVATMRQWWQERWHRSAEQRQLLQQRAALVPVERLRREPHLEMHTRGG